MDVCYFPFDRRLGRPSEPPAVVGFYSVPSRRVRFWCGKTEESGWLDSPGVINKCGAKTICCRFVPPGSESLYESRPDKSGKLVRVRANFPHEGLMLVKIERETGN